MKIRKGYSPRRLTKISGSQSSGIWDSIHVLGNGREGDVKVFGNVDDFASFVVRGMRGKKIESSEFYGEAIPRIDDVPCPLLNVPFYFRLPDVDDPVEKPHLLCRQNYHGMMKKSKKNIHIVNFLDDLCGTINTLANNYGYGFISERDGKILRVA